MAEPLVILVLGRPAPQGSKRAFMYQPKGGGPARAAVIESSHDRVKSWRQAVIDAALEAAAGYCTCGGALDGRHYECPYQAPLTGALEVSMTFRMPRPKSHYRTGRNSHLLRDGAPPYPAGMPDLSKLCRATEDALTDAGTWADDAQVVRYDVLAKAWEGQTTGRPGASITIRSMQ